MIGRYVIPWFDPQTSTVGDISYFMVHEWLLTLVGRRRSEPDARPPPPVAVRTESIADRELSLKEAAEMGEVSVATARRRWRDGALPGAYRTRTDTSGCLSPRPVHCEERDERAR